MFSLPLMIVNTDHGCIPNYPTSFKVKKLTGSVDKELTKVSLSVLLLIIAGLALAQVLRVLLSWTLNLVSHGNTL